MVMPTSRREIDARVTFSRVTSNGPDGDYFLLQIEDGKSCFPVVRINLTLEQTAVMISGSMVTAAKATAFLDHRIGYKQHTMRALVPLSREEANSARLSMDAVYDQAEELNPGWEADRDGWNGHRWKDDHYEVTLRRWEESCG